MESIPVILLGMSIMICVPPPTLLPQNNASCTVLVIWRVKRLAATFRHVQGHIQICWLSVCRIFLTSTFVMKLKSVNFALHSKCTVHTDYNFYFFLRKVIIYELHWRKFYLESHNFGWKMLHLNQRSMKCFCQNIYNKNIPQNNW